MSRDSIAPLLRRAAAQVIVRDWLSSNQVVFENRGLGATVVDTGHVTRSAQTVALLERVLADQPLTRILNTHLHSDHCGGNAALQQRWPGANIAVPVGYRGHLEVLDEEGESHHPMGQLSSRFRPGEYLAAGEVIDCGGMPWECHSAPGHDPDALVFFQPETRLLISGDALWESRLAIIFPALTDASGFDAAHLALDTIERLAPAAVLPGHGEPFTDVGTAVQASRQRLDAFAAAPEKHRRYALRVMVVYHLLEHREVERAALLRWIIETPVVCLAMGCTNGTKPSFEQASSLLESMLDDHVLESERSQVRLAPT